LKALLVLFLGGIPFYLGLRQIRRWSEERHPAVKEHLAELIQAAAEQTGCPAEALKVTVEEPTRARVEACGKTVTFRWGRARRKGLRKIEHWHQIDPDCRFDYMGGNFPCGE